MKLSVMLLWLASLGYSNICAGSDPRSKSKKIYFPLEAHSEKIVSLGGADSVEPNTIYGLVEVSQPMIFDFMSQYTESTCLQLQFWQNILPNVDRFIFPVKSAFLLEKPVPLLQCSDRLLRGFIASLEPGQAERLWDLLHFENHWIDLRCPSMALRVPPQLAFLTCKGIFNSVVLADAGKRSERGGSKGLFVDWDLLGLQKPAAPPSSSLPNMHLDFDKHVARDVANSLRRYCENLDPNDDFDFVEYNHVAQLVSVMMDLQDQLDPVFFTRFAGICNTGPQLLLHMVHNVESSNIKCCGCFKFFSCLIVCARLGN